MHWHKAAHHAFELGLELFFARVDHHLGALAKDKFLDFKEAPQIALIDLLGVHLVHLALVEKDHFVDRRFTFGHFEGAVTGCKESANYNIGPRPTTLGTAGPPPYNARFFELPDDLPWPRSFISKPTVAR
ncbi:hypothetical protein D9M73_167720 [compost metagenome]